MDRVIIGWREWLALPQLNIDRIKAKIDTGARTSSLHAYFIEPYTENGQQMVRFGVHPRQKRHDIDIICHAPVNDYRQVTDSGGHREMRYVINTQLLLGSQTHTIELTLSNRERMTFRMLLGRSAVRGLLVAPDRSYCLESRKFSAPINNDDKQPKGLKML